MALLVLFAAAAGTGIVSADFGAGADGFGGFGLSRASLVLQLLLLPPLARLDLAGLKSRLGARHLSVSRAMDAGALTEAASTRTSPERHDVV